MKPGTKHSVSIAGITFSINFPSRISEGIFCDFMEDLSGEVMFEINLKASNKKVQLPELNLEKVEFTVNRIDYQEGQGKQRIVSDLFSICKTKLGFDVQIPKDIILNPLVIRNSVRCAFAWHLALTDGVLLHSSAVLNKEKVSLFSGVPGAGKTTLAKFSKNRGFEILTDEFTAVKKDKTYYNAYGTPFGGELLAKQKGFLLDEIYFIRQAEQLFIKEVKPIDSILHILQNEFISMSVHFSKAYGINQKIIRTAHDIAKKIKTYDLMFPYDPEIITKLLL